MILIGQFDSPFVRRVALALEFYRFPYEHRPWSTFGDADQLAAFNPLLRVPTLVLDDGDILIESGIILDWLDEIAGPDHALLPPNGIARRRGLKICALASGLAEKSVSLLYERVLRQDMSSLWIDRCHAQIAGVLDGLEADKAGRAALFWFGDAIGHADIAAACAIRFTREAHPALFNPERWPALERLTALCEGLEPFRRIAQPLRPPQPAA